jgi:hypothetical protein
LFKAFGQRIKGKNMLFKKKIVWGYIPKKAEVRMAAS